MEWNQLMVRRGFLDLGLRRRQVILHARSVFCFWTHNFVIWFIVKGYWRENGV